jgi:hypothetical protein
MLRSRGMRLPAVLLIIGMLFPAAASTTMMVLRSRASCCCVANKSGTCPMKRRAQPCGTSSFSCGQRNVPDSGGPVRLLFGAEPAVLRSLTQTDHSPSALAYGGVPPAFASRSTLPPDPPPPKSA